MRNSPVRLVLRMVETKNVNHRHIVTFLMAGMIQGSPCQGTIVLKVLGSRRLRIGGAALALPNIRQRDCNERSDLVKVLCAWCVRDGRPAFLREKLPLEDPSETHGLCGAHFSSLSARVGRVVTPRVWLLSRVNDFSWRLTRWAHRILGRLCALCW